MAVEEKSRKRNPFLAAIATFGAFGLGQLYNGKPRAAAVAYALWISIAGFAILAPLSSSIHWLILYKALEYATGLILMIDAFRGARNVGEIALRPYNRWYIYWAIALLQIFAVIPFQVQLMASSTKAFSIPTQAMSPTLEIGDKLVADMSAYKGKGPARGDVVIFNYPNDGSVPYVKRVIGLPGERFEMSGRVVAINGRPIAEDYAQYIDPYSVDSHYGPYTVPEGSYFMLGDNRDNSQDSRFRGFVSRRQLLGQARYLYWAREWARIGKTLH